MVLPALLTGPVWAAEFELHPTLTVGQYYTDNVNLAPRGQEQSDWVTQATPGLTFNYNGARLKFFASISAELLYRANDGTMDVNPHYNGGTVGSLEIMPQFLFLDTNSTISQQNTTVFGPQALNNINSTNDRATVRSTRVSPYVRYAFGSEAQTEVRYTYSLVTTDQQAARGSDSGGNRIDARVTSGPAYKQTTWNVVYYWDQVDYELARDTTAQSITAGVRHLITPFVGLLLNAGYEDNDYISTTTSPKGPFWSAGIDWNPTPRTTFSATSGRRYYGPSHSLNFRHRTRLTVWNASYSEQISSYRQEVLAQTQTDTATYLDTLYLSRIPDPIARQQAVRDFITQSGLPPSLIVPVNFFTTQTSLNKTWQASAGLQGPRHTFLANFFSSNRETQSIGLPAGAGDFAGSPSVKQIGGGLLWNWRITQLDSSNVSLGYNRSETPGSGQTDDTRSLRAAYVHQFSPKITGSVNYHRLDNNSNVATSGYTENQVSANLQMRF